MGEKFPVSLENLFYVHAQLENGLCPSSKNGREIFSFCLQTDIFHMAFPLLFHVCFDVGMYVKNVIDRVLMGTCKIIYCFTCSFM